MEFARVCMCLCGWVGVCQVSPEVILAMYSLVVSSLCVCVCVCVCVCLEGRTQGRALYLYQQPQLLGTKAQLLKDHVTVVCVCVCVCVCVPPLSCDLSSGQGLRSAESL